MDDGVSAEVRYRTRPVVVDAMRYWSQQAYPEFPELILRMGERPALVNPDGATFLNDGDWMLRCPDGSVRAMGNEEFEERYEKVPADVKL